MIGIYHTTHSTEGYRLTVRYRRFDGKVTLLSTCDASGQDVLLGLDERLLIKGKISEL